MTVVKVIELICEGNSIQAAIESAVVEAAKTLNNIRQVNVDHIEALVENNKIKAYRLIVKISFVVER